MTESRDTGTGVCQNCGGDVLIEVEFELWGVSSLYFECQDCHRSGRTQPQPFSKTREPNHGPDNQIVKDVGDPL